MDFFFLEGLHFSVHEECSLSPEQKTAITNVTQ